MFNRPQKITFAEMRSQGVDRLLVYCSDFRCSHLVAISANRWPDEVRLLARLRLSEDACRRRRAAEQRDKIAQVSRIGRDQSAIHAHNPEVSGAVKVKRLTRTGLLAMARNPGFA
jgi:hypothetical protein